MDDDGVARRGLLVRHLVLPRGLAGARECMEFLAQEISPRTYVNVMGQYRPCGRAHEHPVLAQFLTGAEHAEALRQAREAGLTRLDRRDKLFRWL
jgi:putative pyruvate formate lyase activating enzyme